MTSPQLPKEWLLYCLICLAILICPSSAFGAGNIASTAKIEGQNWRHGDIEDTLLTLLMTSASGGKKFSKMDVKRVYFGNWLRDYSQAVDVGTVKSVSAEAIRIILWVLSFMSFGYATKEFEVTRERLGCYRPEEHIDNPKDYADNIDARQYDRRLRGPVDERRELGVDERTGLKNYIASDDLGICTSSGLVRELLEKSIKLGRRYRRSDDKEEFHEALRLLGTALHCLEDYSAHSNYTELALIELGEKDVFPHVGRDTEIRLRGARHSVYPLVTGTFGGVDFLHSVMGEVSDKAIQSEMQELEGTIESSGNSHNKSKVKDLLDKLPDGLFGGKDEKSKADELEEQAAAAKMQNMHITPREPEAFTRQVQQISKQIYPILEFHDEIMHSITETIDNIPILPDMIEEVQEQVNIYVFSLLAPFVLPIIKQIRSELETGSSEIIESSREKQHIVFHDDRCSDPTHSMLSKDHFTNLLNEPAGRIASQTLRWVVPQIVECWDSEREDADRTIQRIVDGVFHHPALRSHGDNGAREGREQIFNVVEDWWRDKSEREKDDLRERLSRRGVERGKNHKEGVHDKGHGCNKPLGMPTVGTSKSSGAVGGAILSGLTGSSSKHGGSVEDRAMKQVGSEVGKAAGKAVGGGALGGIVGGLVGGVGSSLLGGAFGGKDDDKETYTKEGYDDEGSYKKSYTQTGHHRADDGRDERYGQAHYQRTDYSSGGHREEYQRYEQDGSQARSGHGYEASVESRPLRGGGYERTEEKRYEHTGGSWESEQRREKYTSGGERYSQQTSHHGSGYNRRKDSDDSEDDDDSNDSDDYEKKARKRAEKERKKREKRERKYGRRKSDDSDSDKDKYRGSQRSGHGYGSTQQSHGYGSGGGSGYGQQSEYGSHSGGGGGYGSRREEEHGSSRYNTQSSHNEYGSGGGQQGYGGGSRNEYGGSGYEERSSGGYGSQSYGGNSSGYGGDSGGYGGSTSGYGESTSGYGGGGGGYGGGGNSYGTGGSGYGGRDDSQDDDYRRRQQQQQQSGYGGSSGSGYGGSGYGGGGSGYGGGGYGDSSGYGNRY